MITICVCFGLPAPHDEIGYVVACEKGTAFGSWQEVYVAHGQYRTGQAGSH